MEWSIGDLADFRFRVGDYTGTWKVLFTAENINKSVNIFLTEVGRELLLGQRTSDEPDNYTFNAMATVRANEGPINPLMPIRSMRGRNFLMTYTRVLRPAAPTGTTTDIVCSTEGQPNP